jgi:succinate dehydrogenase/fumarate reductase cytochrome b subunit
VKRSLIITFLCASIAFTPVSGISGAKSSSATWSEVVHEENSIVASVLYLPYVLVLPIHRLLEGIIYPRPASQSTVPPPAHRAPH